MQDWYMTWDELETSMQEFKISEMKKLKQMIYDYDISIKDKQEIHV